MKPRPRVAFYLGIQNERHHMYKSVVKLDSICGGAEDKQASEGGLKMTLPVKDGDFGSQSGHAPYYCLQVPALEVEDEECSCVLTIGLTRDIRRLHSLKPLPGDVQHKTCS